MNEILLPIIAALLVIVFFLWLKIYRQNDLDHTRWLNNGHESAENTLRTDDPQFKDRQKIWKLRRMQLKTQNYDQIIALESLIDEKSLSVRDLALVLDSLSLEKGIHANYYAEISK